MKPILLTIIMILFPASGISQVPSRLFAVNIKDKHGFIDGTGNTVIEPKYEIVRNFSDGRAAVMLNAKWGYIDESGKEIIPPSYEREPGPFREGLAPVAVSVGPSSGPVETKWAFIGKTGKLQPWTLFEQAQPFSDGLAAIKHTSGWGFIDTTGKVVIDPKYGEVLPFSEGRAFIRRGGVLWSLIDKTGREIVGEKFSDVTPFSELLAAVRVNKKWGFIDRFGAFEIEPFYDDASRFSNGLAAVFMNCRYGYIDKTGKMVIEPQFTYAGEFSEELAVVAKKESNYVSRDPNGTRVCIRPSFIGSVGIIDTTGKMAVPMIFGFAEPFSGGLARVTYETPVHKLGIKGEWGYIDTTGKFIWQPDAWKAEP